VAEDAAKESDVSNAKRSEDEDVQNCGEYNIHDQLPTFSEQLQTQSQCSLL
jgi:hypothetical protein